MPQLPPGQRNARVAYPSGCQALMVSTADKASITSPTISTYSMGDVPASSAAMGASTSIRVASPDDAIAIGLSMSNAFQDDPSFAWCIPDSADRKRQLPAFFAVVFDALVGFGRCCCTSDGAAAALWLPPGVGPLTEQQAARLRAVFESVGAVASTRFAALIESMDSHHPHQEHCYLWFLGVSTSVQNQGLGSLLLRSGLDWCDEHSVAAYLEATTVRNRELYERHGFQLIGEMTAEGSPSMWAMWRDPMSC
jgi:ribosomal protein S18 acetylase RimI-like enzyme